MAQDSEYEISNQIDLTRQQKYYRNLKYEVLTAYSGIIPKCAKCATDDLRFLAVDHIADDGNSHRLSTKTHGGYDTYLWLRRNNFPHGFQILCHNCNILKTYEARPINWNNKNRHLWKQRYLALMHYSNSRLCCDLCGVSDIKILTLDHINGGGCEHRRQLGTAFYREIRKLGYPKGLRVLCYNHNQGRVGNVAESIKVMYAN